MTLLPAGGPPPPAAAAAAMRYYRIWIYACNGALLLAALAFCAAGVRALADYRRTLVPGLSAAQPGLLYGYVALPAQAGLLQLLGCLAALRLSERLLNAYWLALLALLLGDAAVGVFWAFRLERVRRELAPALRVRLARDYPADADFVAAWDRLQHEQRCCGAVGPDDFASGNRTLYPASCCRAPPPAVCSPHRTACADRLQAWLRATADALFVIGYCVIAFLKLCFLGILRYEIKEMIQKIKMLQAEGAAGVGGEGGECAGGPLSQTVVVGAPSANGAVRAHSPERADERDALLGRACAPPPEDTPARAPPKTLNGNNNCELRELARGDYRLLAADSAATRI